MVHLISSIHYLVNVSRSHYYSPLLTALLENPVVAAAISADCMEVMSPINCLSEIRTPHMMTLQGEVYYGS